MSLHSSLFNPSHIHSSVPSHLDIPAIYNKLSSGFCAHCTTSIHNPIQSAYGIAIQSSGRLTRTRFTTVYHLLLGFHNSFAQLQLCGYSFRTSRDMLPVSLENDGSAFFIFIALFRLSSFTDTYSYCPPTYSLGCSIVYSSIIASYQRQNCTVKYYWTLS